MGIPPSSDDKYHYLLVFQRCCCRGWETCGTPATYTSMMQFSLLADYTDPLEVSDLEAIILTQRTTYPECELINVVCFAAPAEDQQE